MEVGGQRHALTALPSGKRPGTHCTGGWVGPRAYLDNCGKSPTGICFPDRSARNDSQYRIRYPGPRSLSKQLYISCTTHYLQHIFPALFPHVSALYT